MNESFLPLVGEKQTKFEHEIDKMEVTCFVLESSDFTKYVIYLSHQLKDSLLKKKPVFHLQRSLENLCNFHVMMIKSLFKFVQGAAHLWDLHEIGLARQERNLQVKQYCDRLLYKYCYKYSFQSTASKTRSVKATGFERRPLQCCHIRKFTQYFLRSSCAKQIRLHFTILDRFWFPRTAWVS